MRASRTIRRPEPRLRPRDVRLASTWNSPSPGRRPQGSERATTVLRTCRRKECRFLTLMIYTPVTVTSALIFPLSVLQSATSVSLLSPITALTCTTLHLFCPPGYSVKEPDLKVGLVARRLREEAGRASDIFQSIVELSDLDAMGMLHQVRVLAALPCFWGEWLIYVWSD
jgi:hypothetical protein